MIWVLYNFLFVVGFILLLPRFLYRMCRRGGYWKHFQNRFGCYGSLKHLDKKTRQARVWVHGVSVGETQVALALIKKWREQDPSLRFVISVNTSTGYKMASERKHEDDLLIYFPLDMLLFVRRALTFWKPRMLVLIECELWPNLMRSAHRRNIPICLVNGRISARSFKGYKKLRFFTSRILPLVDVLCVQSEAVGQRLCELGAPESRVHVMNSAKYDVTEVNSSAHEKIAALLRGLSWPENIKILLGGSTWAGEEDILVRIYKKLRQEVPDLRLVLVPRHVERTSEVLKMLTGQDVQAQRRSQEKVVQDPDVLLVDTTGELVEFYACADVVFVGKSLTARGGQNIIEPAVLGRPVVVGPNMQNFPVVFEDFKKADAIIQVAEEENLVLHIRELLQDAEKAAGYGARAQQLVISKKGALNETLKRLNPLLSR